MYIIPYDKMNDSDLVDRKSDLTAKLDLVKEQIVKQSFGSEIHLKLMNDRNDLQAEIDIVEKEITTRINHHDTNRKNAS